MTVFHRQQVPPSLPSFSSSSSFSLIDSPTPPPQALPFLKPSSGLDLSPKIWTWISNHLLVTCTSTFQHSISKVWLTTTFLKSPVLPVLVKEFTTDPCTWENPGNPPECSCVWPHSQEATSSPGLSPATSMYHFLSTSTALWPRTPMRLLSGVFPTSILPLTHPPQRDQSTNFTMPLLPNMQDVGTSRKGQTLVRQETQSPSGHPPHFPLRSPCQLLLL